MVYVPSLTQRPFIESLPWVRCYTYLISLNSHIKPRGMHYYSFLKMKNASLTNLFGIFSRIYRKGLQFCLSGFSLSDLWQLAFPFCKVNLGSTKCHSKECKGLLLYTLLVSSHWGYCSGPVLSCTEFSVTNTHHLDHRPHRNRNVLVLDVCLSVGWLCHSNHNWHTSYTDMSSSIHF